MGLFANLSNYPKTIPKESIVLLIILPYIHESRCISSLLCGNAVFSPLIPRDTRYRDQVLCRFCAFLLPMTSYASLHSQTGEVLFTLKIEDVDEEKIPPRCRVCIQSWIRGTPTLRVLLTLCEFSLLTYHEPIPLKKY